MEFNLNGKLYKEIPSEPGYYSSEYGDIAKIKLTDDLELKSFQLMEHEITSNGYHRVIIKHKRHKSVHRLVYETWGNDELDESKVIDHINGDTSCNNISNLRQVTQRENIQGAVERGTFGHSTETRIRVYNDKTDETKLYKSIKEFLTDINAPEYIRNHGGLDGLKKRKEYKCYHVTKLEER